MRGVPFFGTGSAYVRGARVLTDLSLAARLYLLGHCRGDTRKAEAVALIVFGNHSVRAVARRHRLSPSTLHRLARTLRIGLKGVVSGRIVSVEELLAPHARRRR